jgi:hypothetical protein
MDSKVRELNKTNDNMVMIHEAAHGQIEVVHLIENTIQDKCVPLYLYTNYLFQLALCIELLIKTIVLKEKDCIQDHDQKKLFDFLPESFKEEIYKSRGKKIIEDTLEISKNIFIELRYLVNYGDLSLNLFLTKKAINDNNTVCMKKLSKKELRLYNKAYLLYNPAVSDDDRAAMGLPIHKSGRSPVQKPETAPQLLPDAATRRIIKVYYKDEGASRRGKPAHVKGIEIKWAKLKEAPQDITELINSAFDTNPPLALEFQEHERGEKVFLCGHWEIQREGEKGPWGGH